MPCRRRRCPPVPSCGRCGEDVVECKDRHCTNDVVCDPGMIKRAVELMTQPATATYYVLAACYVFGFSAYTKEHRYVVMYSVLQMLPTIYLLVIVVCSTYVCQSKDFYVRFVALALFLSTVADGFLTYDPDLFVLAVGVYTVVLICLISGLSTKFTGACYAWGVFLVMLALLWLLSSLVEGYLSVLIIFCYGFFVAVFDFFALARYERNRTGPAYLGCAGALMLTISHFLYTLSEFSPGFVCVISAELVQMIGYMAWLCIAQSAHFG